MSSFTDILKIEGVSSVPYDYLSLADLSKMRSVSKNANKAGREYSYNPYGMQRYGQLWSYNFYIRKLEQEINRFQELNIKKRHLIKALKSAVSELKSRPLVYTAGVLSVLYGYPNLRGLTAVTIFASMLFTFHYGKTAAIYRISERTHTQNIIDLKMKKDRRSSS